MSDEPKTPPPDGGAEAPDSGAPKPRGRFRGNAELREFFLRTAELLQLEPRRPDPAVTAAVEDPTKPKGKSLFAGIPPRARLGALVGVTLLLVFMATRSRGPAVLPDTVQGVWRTDAAGYAKRRFEVGLKELAFQTDDSANVIVRHAITKVKTSTVVEGTKFEVDYLDQPEDKSPLTFEFILAIGDHPTIIFANLRKVVWKRVATTVSGS